MDLWFEVCPWSQIEQAAVICHDEHRGGLSNTSGMEVGLYIVKGIWIVEQYRRQMYNSHFGTVELAEEDY